MSQTNSTIKEKGFILINPLIPEFSGHVIDHHMHLFRSGLPLKADRRYAPEYDVTLESYRALCSENGVKGALLVQPSFLADHNRYLLSVLDEIRKRELPFSARGVITVEPNQDYDFQMLSEKGVIGIRFNLVGKESSFRIEDYDRIISESKDLGYHLELYCSNAWIAALAQQLNRGGSQIVIDHFGMPDETNFLESQVFHLDALDAPPIIKASAPYRFLDVGNSNIAAEKCVLLAQELRSTYGENCLIWGSDWPCTQYEDSQTFTDTVRWRSQWAAA
jgi:predicted TIM-barrel fold metal-dependent hydrolase